MEQRKRRREVQRLLPPVDTKWRPVMMPSMLNLVGQTYILSQPPCFFFFCFFVFSECTTEMRRQTIKRHRCLLCPSGWGSEREVGKGGWVGGAGWAGSIHKAAASQTRWLIYCICRVRPACLSGLKNLSYQTWTQRERKRARAESLEAATYGKLGHLSPEWVVWKYSLCLLDFSRQRQEHRRRRTNVRSLSESRSRDESLTLTSRVLIERHVSDQSALHVNLSGGARPQ